jgi:hypothetical protein
MRMLLHVLFLAAAMIPAGEAGAGEPGASLPGMGLRYSGAPQAVPKDAPAQPYAMNYTDEAAQTLGIRNGYMDLFSPRPAQSDSLAPTLSGGIDGGGAMLKLRWYMGQWASLPGQKP